MESLAGIVAIIFAALFLIGVYAFLMAIVVAVYVFTGIGLSKMLRSVGYEKPWFAWIPILNTRAFGDLADHYDNGQPAQGLGKKLMTLSIVIMASSLVSGLFASLVQVGIMFGYSMGGADVGAIVALLTAMILVFAEIAMVVILVFYLIYYYKAMWAIYRMFAPSMSVVLLLVSILVFDISPFAFFALRNKEPQNLRAKDDAEAAPVFTPENPYSYDVNNG